MAEMRLTPDDLADKGLLAIDPETGDMLCEINGKIFDVRATSWFNKCLWRLIKPIVKRFGDVTKWPKMTDEQANNYLTPWRYDGSGRHT